MKNDIQSLIREQITHRLKEIDPIEIDKIEEIIG
jgi:hypothetical protein